MNKALRLIRAAFFPERCPYCGCTIECDKIACDDCEKQFPEAYCKNFAKGGYPCCSPFFYKGIFKNGVRRFKFSNMPQSSEKLAVIMVDCIKRFYDVNAIDAVTYVPMYPKRERERGYNQSKLLAKDISKLLKIPFRNYIDKIKDNEPQHNCLTQAKRRDNVKGAYKAVNKENIKGKTILIIDDILTTGYTLGECCKVLEKETEAKLICAALCAKNDIST